jgi:hypothetical protein
MKDDYFEYVIWGKPPGRNNDDLLMTVCEGKPITDKDLAERLCRTLEKYHGCTDTRIQTLDFVTLPWQSSQVKKMINL